MSMNKLMSLLHLQELCVYKILKLSDLCIVATEK